jgi:hypothetical protein
MEFGGGEEGGQKQEAAASVPARPITFDCGDEAVGVDEAHDQ